MTNENKKNDTVTFRVPQHLLNEFKQATQKQDRPASQVLRELMKSYINKTSTSLN